jgi:DNA-binding GntR family transcriptional regulator
VSPGPTFERVYHALKDQLGGGRYAAGQQLEPASLSYELNASITPVRDALHRLVGEGLVEAPRGDGFRTPLVTEVGLRHLYRWNAALLRLAAQARGVGQAPIQDGESERRPKTAEAMIEATEHLFLAIAARSGNPEHAAAVLRLNGRLRPVRQIELAMLPDCEAEVDEMAARLAEDAMSGLRRSLAAFHRRRERQVGEIVAALVAPR